MWQYTTKSDGGANQCIQLFVAADGKLEMAWGDTFDFQVLGSVLDLVSILSQNGVGR